MYFDELETDRSYLSASGASYFDTTPWTASSNLFVRRMAANIKTGMLIQGMEREALAQVLATAVSTRKCGLTVEVESLDGTAGGSFNWRVVGLYDYFVCPWQADSAGNLELALQAMHHTRPKFFLSLIPQERFWVHTEHALHDDGVDWNDSWIQQRMQ